MSFYSLLNPKKNLTIKNRTFSVWREFPTQQKAFDFVDAKPSKDHSLDLAIFSFEYNEKEPGLRKFLVSSSKKDFYYEYMEMNHQDRHFYEMIRESYPCCLYFDLEFCINSNPSIDGDQMLNHFKITIMDKLCKDFSLDRDQVKVIDLVSTTETKFSHHLIFRINGWMFENNAECGIFASTLLDETGNEFLVVNKQQEPVSLVDLSVYSKNRNFRLVLSSKIGKNAVFSFANMSKNSRISLEMFLESLVCYKPSQNCRLLSCRLKSNRTSQHQASGPKKQPYFNTTKSSLIQSESPYPDLERYLIRIIESKAQSSSSTPRISSYIHYKESQVVVYCILGGRYCERINREHSSNGQFYVADLIKMHFIQKCFDPECRGFQSLPIPFPKDLCEEEDLFSGISDELLNQIELDSFI